MGVEDGELLELFDGLVPRPTQRHPVSRQHHVRAWRTAEGYRIVAGGREDSHPTARSAVEGLVRRMHELDLEALAQFTKVHAGCASWEGRRLLVVGPGQSGKTTLMTRLLYDGFAVHSDDITLLRDGDVLPYPEHLSLRPSTVELIPELAALPASVLGGGQSGRLALDPSKLGFPWWTDLAPADAVFFLAPNHGGATWLEPCAKHAMAERVMAQSSLPAGGARDWVRDVCALIDGAECHVLRCGDLRGVASTLKHVMR